MTLEEFNRPFSEAELRAKFEKEGFDESLGLIPINEALTYEDEEYLRIKRELMESGIDEISAGRRAYETVFSSETPELPTHHISASEQVKQNMLHMLFPNDEDYQDYLDGEI